ncbi:IS4 family transposase [Methylotuvimicrobium buryatense]|uniref:IS4 family transposase n=1 Tax=Methylotuvimicrobium buryatense TaxID=95641 RepID=UPI001F2AAFEE|nr:IS4 family transposase [Methylotuvimicrobium buryatense]
MCDSLEERSGVDLTPQALCGRMNSDGAVQFMEAALTKTLRETVGPPLTAQEAAWLAPFPRVLLQDSSQIEVNEALTEAFQGSGGNASTASVKIDFSYDVKNERAEHIAIRQGTDSDQGFATDVLARVRKGDLIIRDLGYFSLAAFAQIMLIGAYFLSRLSYTVNLYKSADEAASPINLIQYINRFGGGQQTMEFSLFAGEKHRLPIRLVVYRLPQEVYRKRQKAAIKTAKRKGRRARLSYLKFLKYSFFMTNVPADVWPKEALGTLYRLRWQVELTFKHWKSLFCIDLLKGTRPERIRCLLYGRLIVILTVQRLLALAARQAENEGRELSFDKAIQWLLRQNRFLKAFVARQFDTLMRKLLGNLRRLLKAKRKRRTTRQLIAQQVGYLDSFSDSSEELDNGLAAESYA